MLHKKQLRNSALGLMAFIFSFMLIGAVLFKKIEGWSFMDALYFSAMTATTIGYGDFVPTHNWSKAITMLYSFSIIPMVLYTFSIVARYNVEAVRHRMSGIEKEQKNLEEGITDNKKRILAQKKKLQQQEEENIKQEAQILAQKALIKQELEEIERAKTEIQKTKKELRGVEETVAENNQNV